MIEDVTNIPRVGNMKFGDIELIIYSGPKDGAHMQGVGLIMNNEATNSCLGLKGINIKILVANLGIKKSRVAVIVVCAL